MVIALCFGVMVGGTYAWFTDEVSSSVCTVESGTLRVGLEMKDDNGEWVDANGKTLMFKVGGAIAPEGTKILWEPGCTYELPELRVINKGNLALKYKVIVSGVKGDAELNEVITWTIGENAVSENVKLLPGEAKNFVIKGHMLETAGNNYQGLTISGIGIKVLATQVSHESDSKDDSYDDKATYYPVIDAAGMKDALASGGNVQLVGDVVADDTLVAEKNATIDMNEKTLSNTEDVWDKTPNSWSLVSARGEGVKLVVKGNGTVSAKENDCYAVDVQDGATVIIKDGTFIGNIHAVYVLEGKAIVEGGFFAVQQKYPDAAKANEFVLNCYDANRANGTASIVVKGGTFVNFNPADCYAEGAHTNFLAEGYTVIAEAKGEDTWYTVVKGSGTGVVAGSKEEITDAITGNDAVTVKITNDGTYTLPSLEGKDVTIIGTKDTVIDMKEKLNNGATNVSLEGVTVEFGSSDYKGFQHTGKLTYKDCVIKGKQFLYGENVEFIGCTFEQENVDYNVWTYGAGNVLFENCVFNCVGKAVLIYNEGHIDAQSVEFRNCTFNASAPVDGKAAIEIDSSFNVNYTVIIDKATSEQVTGFGLGSVSGNSVWNEKRGNKTTVIVNGETVRTANV